MCGSAAGSGSSAVSARRRRCSLFGARLPRFAPCSGSEVYLHRAPIRWSGRRAGRDVGFVRGGVKVSSLGVWEGGGGRPPGGVRQEQPPSFSNSPAKSGLAEESPRAGGEETESEGTARRGDDGRPPRLLGRTVRSLSGGDAGEQKLRPRVARFGVVPAAGFVGILCCGFIAALGFEVLRFWRSSASARRVGPAARPGSVSAFGGSATLQS